MVLPSAPDCEIYGALTTFSSVNTLLSSVVFTLDTVFSSGTISVKIKNIKNPVQTVTDVFIVSTKYDEVVIDQSDILIKDGKVLTIKEQGSKITMMKFSFNPQNEGEVSEYLFNFVPTNS